MSPNGPGGVDHADRSVAGGNSVNHVDPYPALTAANNAYNQSVAAWQRANNSYQQALAEQEAIRDKYVDAATNTVRPGYDYYTAETVVRSADDKVQDAWGLQLIRRQRLETKLIVARQENSHELWSSITTAGVEPLGVTGHRQAQARRVKRQPLK